MYRDNQGHLTDPDQYGSDRLSSDEYKKQIRHRAFVQKRQAAYVWVENLWGYTSA